MITPITATFPALNFPKEVNYPTQEDWAAFSAAAEQNYGILSGEWSLKAELYKNQMNTLALQIQDIGNNAITAITLDIVDDLATYIGTGLVMVKDINRGGTFVSKTEVDIDPNTGSVYTVNGGTVFAKLGGGFWVRQYSKVINVKWFGAKGDGTTDDTLTIQNAIDYCSTNKRKLFVPIGTYIINGGLTVDDYINLEGEGLPAKFLTQSEFKLTNPSGGSVLLNGQNIFYSLKNMTFSTDDDTVQRNLFRVGLLGDYDSQNSLNSISIIRECVFTNCGGTAVQLGGEHYGSIENNVFRKVAQAIVINKAGEMVIDRNHFSSLTNPAFTAGANNENAFVYIRENVTKFTNNVMAMSEDYRKIFYFYNIRQVVFDNNKIETPGRTTFTYPLIDIYDDLGRLYSFSNNYIVASSATGALAHSIINIQASSNIYRLALNNNIITYGAAVDSTVPIINYLANPKIVELNGNHREGSDNSFIKFVEAEPIGQIMSSIIGTDVQYVTVRSKPFTVLANQTNTVVPFGGRDYLYYIDGSLQQVLPVYMTVQASTYVGGNISFKYQFDSSNSDLVSLPSTNSDVTSNFTKFGLRSQYIKTPDQVAQIFANMTYTSAATVSTSVEYVVEFTYMLITDGNASRFAKFTVDIG